MGVKQITTFECDLCQSKTTASISSVPKGWVQISIDGVLDRTWDEKAVCGECLKLIDQKRKAKP